MAHLLAPATAVKLPISAPISKKNTTNGVYSHRIWACSEASSNQSQQQSLPRRRTITVGFLGAVAGSINIGGDCRDANAAGKRPPPPPPKEKLDPSVTGVTAKILASKKRKEAMKDAVAKLRERGKAINEP